MFHVFQFTPLREGRLSPGEQYRERDEFQFTPLREGRRAPLPGDLVTEQVSIHAPA